MLLSDDISLSGLIVFSKITDILVMLSVMYTYVQKMLNKVKVLNKLNNMHRIYMFIILYVSKKMFLRKKTYNYAL